MRSIVVAIPELIIAKYAIEILEPVRLKVLPRKWIQSPSRRR